eukprot:COSAG01_NODE_1080_length_11819_cov_29.816212_1_plen_150_part_00
MLVVLAGLASSLLALTAPPAFAVASSSSSLTPGVQTAVAGHLRRAQIGLCGCHSDCPINQYCSLDFCCELCTSVSPTFCDAVPSGGTGDCCCAQFLVNCPLDPAGCAAPAPEPAGGDPTDPPDPVDGGDGGSAGWIITITLLTSTVLCA